MKRLSIGITGSDDLLKGDFKARTLLADRISNSDINHLFVADHISFHTGLGMDALINSATLAAIMPEMTIVTGVYLLALRHPVVVARQLSSLSLSAPGRIVFGIGIGGEDRHEMEICGVDPSKRGSHTNHSLEALRKLMTGEKVSHNSDFFNFRKAQISPPPKPEIPILIGGRSEAAIRRTAKFGDGWLGVWVSPDRFRNCVSAIEETGTKSENKTWVHGIQLWAGVGKDARTNVARGMEDIYKVPFEKFERYSPYGSAERIGDFLSPYIEAGARIINIEARGNSKEESIDIVSEVSSTLHQRYPEI